MQLEKNQSCDDGKVATRLLEEGERVGQAAHRKT